MYARPPVASEIRSIQRRGRAGRAKAGEVIFLITKDTKDEVAYWTAQRKEKRMKRIVAGWGGGKGKGKEEEGEGAAEIKRVSRKGQSKMTDFV